MKLVIDPSKSLGPVKPVNGVGQPPFFGVRDFPMFRYLKEAGIPFSRLHDVGGMFGRNVFVDIPNVFRDFDADETDPANYDFAFTDVLLGALVENGVEPFYRLGVTIENYATIRRYRIDPPKDFAKWARICEHVVRHYTEGWAEGFHYKITHWEIWNEPENWVDEPEKNQMWHGSFEEYCRLYEIASKHLKAAFPHLKIGGYGSCGVAYINGWKVERARHHVECLHAFLKFVREHGCPLDFFSYHSYSTVAEMMEQARYVRDALDSAGFARVPTCLDEWLPLPNHEKLGTALQAAEVAAALIALQNGPVDSAAIYDARCGLGDYSPLFNPLTYKPHKAYWAFLAFNELRKRGTAVRVDAYGGAKNLYVAAALTNAPLREGGGGEADSPSNAPLREGGGGEADSPFNAPLREGGGGEAAGGSTPCASLAVMLANPGDEEVPFKLAIADGLRREATHGPQIGHVSGEAALNGLDASADASASRCRIVDETRTWEETPLPAALPPHSILLVEVA